MVKNLDATSPDFLKQAPLLRYVMLLMTGIAIRIQAHLPATVILFILFITFLIAFCFVWLKGPAFTYNYDWIFGINIQIVFVALGFILTDLKLKSPEPGLTVHANPAEFICTVDKKPEAAGRTVQCFVSILEIKESSGFKRCKEKALVSFLKNEESSDLKTGDLLLVKGNMEEPDNPVSPDGFNYRKFLYYQGIRISVFADSSSWKKLSSIKLAWYKKWIITAQEKIRKTFSDMGLKDSELGVTASLVIGDKTYLNNEIKKAYIGSGTMHILAVSGMHVAMLYGLLNLILSFLHRVRYGTYLKITLLLGGIWVYAFIAGSGPSILRAATMVTFVIMGELLQRKMTTFNSLAASAFFLLLLNPLNLIDVGFQLSYAAIIGILLLFPPIYGIWKIDNWLVNQIWSLTAVTFAAQLTTMPISLFYFHQFPNLFLFSNLLAIPLSTFIIYLALFFLPFSGIHWVSLWSGKILAFMVSFLNHAISWIEKLPFALTPNISLTLTDVSLLYLIIAFLFLYTIKKRSIYFILMLSSVLFMVIIHVARFVTDLRKEEVIFYNSPKNIVIQFRDGPKNIWLVSNLFEPATDPNQFSVSARENKFLTIDSVQKQARGDGVFLTNRLWINDTYIQFAEKRLAIVKMSENKRSFHPVRLDFLFLRNSRLDSISIANLFASYSPGLIIIDPSFPRTKALKFEAECLKKKIKTYNIRNKGAMRTTIY